MTTTPAETVPTPPPGIAELYRRHWEATFADAISERDKGHFFSGPQTPHEAALFRALRELHDARRHFMDWTLRGAAEARAKVDRPGVADHLEEAVLLADHCAAIAAFLEWSSSRGKALEGLGAELLRRAGEDLPPD